jgi:hypothetical protein
MAGLSGVKARAFPAGIGSAHPDGATVPFIIQSTQWTPRQNPRKGGGPIGLLDGRSGSPDILGACSQLA